MRSEVRCALFPVYKADDRGKFGTVWDERVARALQSSGLSSTPYMAMSVHGPARTGKSSLMCHMASWLVKLPGAGRADPGQGGEARPSLAPLWEGASVPEWSECQWTGETVPTAFKASNLDIPCTAGVDAFACLLPAGTLGRATDLLVLLFDCEGRGDKDTTHDLRVTLPALAASSNGLLIFNTMNPPQPHSVLSSMEEFVDAAELIGMHMANADRVKPTFVNLTRDSGIRDFAVDAHGNAGPVDVHYEPARPDSNRGGWHQGRPHRSAVEQRVLEKEAVGPASGDDDDGLGPEEEGKDDAASSAPASASAPASGASRRNRMRSRLWRACHDVQIVRLGTSKTTLPAQMRASFAAMLGNRIKAAGTQEDKVFGLDAYPMVGGKLLQVLSDVVESSNAVQDPRKGWLSSWLSHTLKQIERAGREYSDTVQRKAFDQTISRDCPLGCTRGIGQAVGQLMEKRIRETVQLKAKELWAESMFDCPSARDGLTAALDKLTGAKCGPALVAHALDERAKDDRKHLLSSTQSAAVLAFEQVWQRHYHVAVSGRRIPELQQSMLQARQATEQASCMRYTADGSAKSDNDVLKEFHAAHDSAKTAIQAAKDALEQDASARLQAMKTAQRHLQSHLEGSLRDIELTHSERDITLQDGCEGDEAATRTDRTECLAQMGAMQLLKRMQPDAATGASSPPAETGSMESGASSHGSATDHSSGESGPASGAGASDPPSDGADGAEGQEHHDSGVCSSSAGPEPIGAFSSAKSDDEGDAPLPRLVQLWGCCQANIVLCGFRPTALAVAVAEPGKNPHLATFMRDLETSSTKQRSIQLEMLSQLSQQLQSSRLHMSGAYESRARLRSLREEFENTKLEVEKTEDKHKEQIKQNQDQLEALKKQRQKDKAALDQQLQQAERAVQDMIDRLNRGPSIFGAVLGIVSAGLTIGSAFLTGGASLAMGGMGAAYGWASKKVDE